MSKKVAVSCPKCNTILTMEKPFFGSWRDAVCPKCETVVKPDQVRNATAYCPKCNREVAINGLKNHTGDCPFCHGELEMPHKKAVLKKVPCPACGGIMELEGNPSGIVKCEHCNRLVNIDNAKNADAPAAIRITNMEMKTDDVLWKYPAQRVSLDSVVSPQAGTVAMVVSGSKCLAIIGQSQQKLRDVIGGEGEAADLQIMFARIKLNKKLLWAADSLSLQDGRFTVSGTADRKLCARGSLSLKIVDLQAFAERVRYSVCTEDQLGLQTISASGIVPGAVKPEYRIEVSSSDISRRVEKACHRLIGEEHCSLMELSNYLSRINEYICQELTPVFTAEWGLEVTACDVMGFPQITRESLKPMNRQDLLMRVTQEILWQTPQNIQLHLKDRPQFWAMVVVYGTAKVTIVDETKLRNHMDAMRWEMDSDNMAAVREIGEQIGKQLYDRLPAFLQDRMNYHADMTVSALPLYLQRINQELMDDLNNSLPYLYQHGLQVDTFTTRLDVKGESPLLQKWNEMQGVQQNSQMQRVIDQITSEDDLIKIQTRDKMEAQAYASGVRAQDQREAVDFERDMNRIERTAEIRRRAEELNHISNLRGLRYAGEEQIARDENAMNAARRSFVMENEMNQHTRQQQFQQKRHEQLLNEVMIAISESSLSLQEKIDAYARLKRTKDAIAEADATRSDAAGEADAKWIAAQRELNISAEAQALMEQATQMQHEREMEKNMVSFEQQMISRRVNIEFEMDKLRLQAELRERDKDAEERELAMRQEIEKLRITLDCYEKLAMHEANSERAKEAAERARAQAEKEISRRQDEEYRREQEKRESIRRRREEQAREDAKRARQLMDEMRELQRQIAEERRSRGAEVGGTQRTEQDRRLDELMRTMEEMIRGMNGGSAQPSAPYGQPAAPYAQPSAPYGYAPNPAYPQEKPSGAYGYQPGVLAEQYCPSCGKQVSPSARFCPFCSAALRP